MFDAVPDAVLVLALPKNELETSRSQKRARKGRFSCFSIRTDRAPYLPSKMHYVHKGPGVVHRQKKKLFFGRTQHPLAHKKKTANL